MRHGVIDLGSSTFHALVADVDAHGVRRILFDRSTTQRLGDHADSPHGLPRAVHTLALDALRELAARARQDAGGPVKIVATGVLRDSRPGRAFVADAAARLQLPIEILDERDEARLTWIGVSSELAGSHGKLAVLDLGGGSLEVSAGITQATYTTSMPLGVLRMRRLSTTALRDLVERTAAAALGELATFQPDTLALSSGTARTLLRVARKLGIVHAQQRHVPNGAFLELARRLPQLSDAALIDFGVSTARLDTIAVGAAVFALMLARLSRPVIYIAASALREGILVEEARTQIDYPADARRDLFAPVAIAR